MEETNQETARRQLELELGKQLNALISAAHALNVKTAAFFDPALQPAAFLLVRWLLSYGPASATQLADATAMDRSSVSRLMAQLKQAGYVQSEPHPEDRRGVLISLTVSGREQALLALQVKEAAFYRRISGWEEEKLASFVGMLQAFNGQGEA